MPEMMGKPEWIKQVRSFAIKALSGPDDPAYEDMAFLYGALLQYEASDELGGPMGAKVLRRLGTLKQSLGLDKVPGDLEAIGWSLITFGAPFGAAAGRTN